jgi:CBS domain-containing protein
MVEDPISVQPDMPTVEAVKLMRRHQIGALPVVREDHLVGIITERDFIEIAGNLLDDSLGIEDVTVQSSKGTASSSRAEAGDAEADA